jgi:CO/xanthine dehydrogenase Mo-binding subunit
LRTIADLRWTVLDESVIVGLPTAVFAAMFNATGKRVTDLAITRQRRLWRYALIQ